MRKFAMFLIICVLFLFSCRSTPDTTETVSAESGTTTAVSPEPAGTAGTAAGGTESTAGSSAGGTPAGGTANAQLPTVPSRYETGSIEDTLYNIYHRHSGNLDLTGAIRYTVKSGDRLNQIAAEYYHDSHFYPVIMLASRDVIVDPNKIIVGMVLIIPDLPRNLSNPVAKQAIKDVIYEVAVTQETTNPGAAVDLRALADRL